MKTLKQIVEMKKNEKPESTFPIEPDSTTALVPRSKDEKRFYDKHVIAKKADANGNGDDVFNASNIKAYDRSASKHGYNTKEDQAVYEGRTLFQILGERKMTPAEIKKRSEIADSIKEKHPEYSDEKKFRIATAAAMKEGVVGSVAKQIAKTLKGANRFERVPAPRAIVSSTDYSDKGDELTESELAEGQYNKHFNSARKLLDDIGDAMDIHSSHVSNGERTPEWHHVETIKNLHRQLTDLHDELLRHADYAKPLQIQKESIGDLLNKFDPATAQILQTIYETVNDDDKKLIESMMVEEDLDGLQKLLDEVGQ